MAKILSGMGRGHFSAPMLFLGVLNTLRTEKQEFFQ